MHLNMILDTHFFIACPKIDGNMMNAVDAGQVHPPGGGLFAVR